MGTTALAVSALTRRGPSLPARAGTGIMALRAASTAAVADLSHARTHVATASPSDASVTRADESVMPRDAQERFRVWILPELGILHAMAMRMTRSPHEAEDLVQDTLVRAWRAIDRFDGRYPRAWVLTILRNTHINRLRKKRPDLAYDPDVTFGQLASDDGRDTVADDALDRLRDPVLLDALADLTDAHRAVLGLVDVDGLSYQEAADLLDVPIGTIMSRLHRARRALRSALADRGAVPEEQP